MPRDKALEETLLQAAYDVCLQRNARFAGMQEVFDELDEQSLGLDRSTPEYSDRLLGAFTVLQGRGLVEGIDKSGTAIRITEKGINEVEGRNEPQQPSQTVNVGTAYNSMVGFNTNSELTNNINFAELDREIEEKGGEDKEELREARQELERITATQDSVKRGAFQKISHLASKHPWFFGRLMDALLGFVTQK